MNIAIGGYQVFQLLLFFWTFTLHPAQKFNVCKQPNETKKVLYDQGYMQHHNIGATAVSKLSIRMKIMIQKINERIKNIRKLWGLTYLLKWLIFNIETLVIKFALVSCPVQDKFVKSPSQKKNEISKNQTLFITIIVKQGLDSQCMI